MSPEDDDGRPRHRTGPNVEITTTSLDTTSLVGRGASVVRRAQRDAVETCRQRRDRVLAHQDLARQLTQAPLSYSRPEVWNGYVPPLRGPYGRRWPDGSGVDDELNNSRRRRALIDLLNVVADRERERRDAA